ncbi:hypothetical protein B0H14DRAFT_3423187 [Mycena olivaceomarginata]|nr:hypothetical protein B0H14DRAFT_3423187 [Mycena olivaceomarginata]
MSSCSDRMPPVLLTGERNHGAARFTTWVQGARLQAENAVWCDPEPAIPSDDLNLGDVYDLPKSLNLLLKHATLFSNLISQFSEIHPYAKFACSVLTMACKVVEAQNDRDNRFRQLIKVTSDTFLFLNTLKVSALEGHRQTIKLLTLQTTECAYFIRDYTKQKSFIIRAGTTLLSGGAINDKIAEYQKIFEDLKAAFRLGSALNTEITVMRIAEQLDRIETAGEIDDLPYAAARFDVGKQCLEGTREAILEKIFTWVNNSDADASRVLLLNGPSGTGKSAIAHTVSRQFNELRRLGSSFFFLRAKPERSPERIFTTIARDMADLDQGWKVALKQVAAPRALRRTGSIREQFEEFILKPAQRLPVYFGPVVIVIDALDAVGDPHARRTLLSLLSTRTAELPGNFRIIVTARADADICDAFKNQDDIEWWPMDTVIEEEANLEDIKEFLTNELSGVVGLRWSDKLCHKLARKSERDFGWAVFACTFVKTTGRRIKSPTDRVRRLLSKPKACTAAQLEAEDSESESDFFHDKIRDKLHIPHILAGHSVLDIWHPQAHKYPETVAPSFPVASPHVEGPFAPWVAPFGADAHYASKFVGEPEHY